MAGVASEAIVKFFICAASQLVLRMLQAWGMLLHRSYKQPEWEAEVVLLLGRSLAMNVSGFCSHATRVPVPVIASQ